MTERHRDQAPQTDDGEAHYRVTDQVGFLIRKAHQRHTAIFQRFNEDKQLTPMQFTALCCVLDEGPRSLTELVRSTAIDQATIRGVVHRLKDRSLIELISDRDDQRKVIIQITAAGHDLVKRMIPKAREITEKTLEHLNPAERIALAYLLNKLNGD